MLEIKKAFLLDGMGLLFRYFYAFQGKISLGGVYGTAQFLENLNNQKWHQGVIALDSPTETFRHRIYQNYKIHRKKMPDELLAQLEFFHELLETWNLKIWSEKGYEADDGIASYAHQWATPSRRLMIYSGDKDFLALVQPGVEVWAPTKQGWQELHEANILEKMGCLPKHVSDFLALMGDACDGVPGVKGIGKKGAQYLVNHFGSLDEIYGCHWEKIPVKYQKILLQGKKEAYLSKQLIQLEKNLKIPNWDHDPWTGPNEDRLQNLYEKLGFKSLIKKV